MNTMIAILTAIWMVTTIVAKAEPVPDDLQDLIDLLSDVNISTPDRVTGDQEENISRPDRVTADQFVSKGPRKYHFTPEKKNAQQAHKYCERLQSQLWYPTESEDLGWSFYSAQQAQTNQTAKVDTIWVYKQSVTISLEDQIAYARAPKDGIYPVETSHNQTIEFANRFQPNQSCLAIARVNNTHFQYTWVSCSSEYHIICVKDKVEYYVEPLQLQIKGLTEILEILIQDRNQSESDFQRRLSLLEVSRCDHCCVVSAVLQWTNYGLFCGSFLVSGIMLILCLRDRFRPSYHGVMSTSPSIIVTERAVSARQRSRRRTAIQY